MSLKVTYSFACTKDSDHVPSTLSDLIIVILVRLSVGEVESTLCFAPCQSHIMVQHFAGEKVTDTPHTLRWDGTYVQWSTEKVILHIQEENRYAGEDSSFHAELPYDPSFLEVLEGIAALE